MMRYARLLFLVSASMSALGVTAQEVGAPSPGAHTLKRQPVTLHGTVNILIANSHGLVLVTDSRLSRDNVPTGVGQKLFQLDAHTICSIAGWYSSSGPTADGVHFPAYAAIPNVINFVVRSHLVPDGVPFEEKIHRYASAIAFTLDEVDAIAEAAGDTTQPQESQMLFAETEPSGVRVATVDILRISRDGQTYYSATKPEITPVLDSLVHLEAGITNITGPALLLEKLPPDNTGILDSYQTSMKSSKGASLSLASITLVARKLEEISAKSFRGVVGGPVQMATIEQSRVELQQPIVMDADRGSIIPGRFGEVKRLHLLRAGESAVGVGEGAAAIVADAVIGDSRQVIDRVLFFRTQFINCELVYNGSPDFYLDPSDVFVNSQLELGQGVDRRSSFVESIHAAVPSLPIVDSTGSRISFEAQR